MTTTDKIAILIDSGTDVPPSLIEKYHMFTAPLRILFTDGEYRDGVDISSAELYRRLPQEVPKTSLPAAEDVNAALAQIRAEGYNKILAVAISSGLSGTYNMLNLIASATTDLDMYVFDTRNIAIGSGFFAIQAAEYLAAGMDWETLKETLSKQINKSKVFYCLDTLEYLQKGGRIGLVTAMFGTALKLKPIISCNEDGVYYTVAKVRGRQQSLKKLMELAQEFAGNSKNYNVAIIGSGELGLHDAASIRDEALARLPHRNLLVDGELGCCLGVHVGPGLVGIGVQILD